MDTYLLSDDDECGKSSSQFSYINDSCGADAALSSILVNMPA